MDLPDLGIKLGSPAMQVDSLPTELSRSPNRDKKDRLRERREGKEV